MAQEDLTIFLALAEDLGIQGLVKKNTKLNTPEKEEKSNVSYKEDLESAKFIDKEENGGTDDEINQTEFVNDEPLADAYVKVADDNDTMMKSKKVESETYKEVPSIGLEANDVEPNVTKMTTPMMKNEEHDAELKPSSQKCKEEAKRQTNTQKQMNKSINIRAKPAINVIKLCPYLTDASYPIQCPVCNIGVKTKMNLNAHMQMKREKQCQQCKLFFGNCQRLCIHSKGRCKASLT